MRSEKRERRASEILDAAAEVFAEKGFDESHVGAIAARADVVAGTVYNYFGSKDGLILALTARYARETVRLREGLVADPPDDPLAALDSYNAIAFDNSLRQLSKPLWRRVLQAGMASGENLSAMMPMIDELLLGQVTRMLQTLQRRGRVRDDVNVGDLAAIALAIQTIHWQRFVASDTLPLAQVKRFVNRHTRLALNAFVTPKQCGGSKKGRQR